MQNKSIHIERLANYVTDDYRQLFPDTELSEDVSKYFIV
jgi:hypothetical protein